MASKNFDTDTDGWDHGTFNKDKRRLALPRPCLEGFNSYAHTPLFIFIDSPTIPFTGCAVQFPHIKMILSLFDN